MIRVRCRSSLKRWAYYSNFLFVVQLVPVVTRAEAPTAIGDIFADYEFLDGASSNRAQRQHRGITRTAGSIRYCNHTSGK
jgi:hypothetical protein